MLKEDMLEMLRDSKKTQKYHMNIIGRGKKKTHHINY